MNAADYKSLHDLPPLAGLCSMQRAVEAGWNLDESVNRLKRLHYVLKRLHETLLQRITGEPIYELKTLFSHHAYLCGEQVTLLRGRVGEMREPPLGLDHIPHEGLQLLMDEIAAAPSTEELVLAVYAHLLPEIVDSANRLTKEAHPLADAPTVRVGRLIAFELGDVVRVGRQVVDRLVESEKRRSIQPWCERLNECLRSAGQLDGRDKRSNETPERSNEIPERSNETPERRHEIPEPWHSVKPYEFMKEPARDDRFQDPFNAGVNPEAFLYDDRFDPRDKTLMMYYKRIRELDVPEMMASILVELRQEEPWEFHMEMSRQLWDEARHAMMGEVGFVAQGLPWQTIPINYTWSRNLNLQLNARERHGVLFFIEQGLMPRTGKRYEWEVAKESGDPLSALFQDFDWADEVLHAQIGRRWYVRKYDSLNEAMKYGDQCWSKVLSHWREYRDDGLTDHRNWWPELYRAACQKWGKTPDPEALAFCETYEDSRADLQRLTRDD